VEYVKDTGSDTHTPPTCEMRLLNEIKRQQADIKLTEADLENI